MPRFVSTLLRRTYRASLTVRPVFVPDDTFLNSVASAIASFTADVALDIPGCHVPLDTPTGIVIVDIPASRVRLDAVTGVAMLETPTGIEMLETPTAPPTVAFVAISKATELTTAVEKNTAPVSKKLVSPDAVIVLTLTGTVTLEADTGVAMLETPNGIVALDTRTAFDILDTPNGIVALDTLTTPLDTVTGVAMLETPNGIVALDTRTAFVILDTPTGIEMLETPTAPPTVAFVAISKATELTTAVEKNAAPVSKKLVSPDAVIVLTPTGTVTLEADTGVAMLETPNGIAALDTLTTPLDTVTGIERLETPYPALSVTEDTP